MDRMTTWRELLGTLVKHPQERQRLAAALGIHPLTLARWVSGAVKPRPRTLYALPGVVPSAYRRQMAELLLLEYPASGARSLQVEEEAGEIPTSFYASALQTYTSTPHFLRCSSMRLLIVQQMLGQLDPRQSGMAVLLVGCMPPSDGKVRSVRLLLGRGNPPWKQIDHHTQFMGNESQIGQAIQSAHLITVQQASERHAWFPIHQGLEESAVACPLLVGGRVAGGVTVLSSLPHYFTPERIELIQRYVALLALGFEDEQFVPISQIDLSPMPSFIYQQTVLMQVQQQVMQYLTESMRDAHPLTRSQAEQLAWQACEERCIRLALAPLPPSASPISQEVHDDPFRSVS